jgi:transposase
MIVIGADTHKSTHALAAVDAGTGQILDEREITADDSGHREALQWGRQLDPDVVWALEDCRHVSHHLERALVTSGERVVRVPPKLMGVSRRGEREAGKSDQIDARSVARAVLREGIDRFPGAFLDEAAMEIRLLCDHREGHVREITRLTNQLRWHLVILDPALEASIPARKMDYPGQLEKVARRLRSMDASARVRIAKEHVRRIRELSREATRLKRELHTLIAAHRPDLLAETGCSTITAAILIGQTAGAERFPTDSHFARMAGVAPIPVSSGRTDRPRLHRGGNAASTARCTSSRSPAGAGTPPHALTSNARKPKARTAWRPSDASSASSHATSTPSSYSHQQDLPELSARRAAES